MNAPNRDFFEGLKRALCRVVAHEMRGVALTLPREDVKPAGPHDYDAEQDVLSALLCEHTTIEALAPLETRHFYSTFNQHLFAALAASSERDLQAITDALETRGPVLEELTIIRDGTPFASAPRLREHVNTIMARWLERELIRTMQQLDAELRVGAITVDGAKLRLREFFMGNSG
ncbi:MAG TPA: DnaB-like helicase N-terminal domain-containing protein [Polyangiaceae bacterium]